MSWEELVADELSAAGVGAAAFVPDARLAPVARSLAARSVPVLRLTREEECVGFAAGYRLAGGRPAVLLQCSGLGNAFNALGSLVVPYGAGLPLIVSMRGTLGEENPSQIPIGRATSQLLGALGIQSFSARTISDVRNAVRGVLRMAADADATAAVLLEPELGGECECD